jgi:DNA-binding transcriptional ArsR family regulator
MTVHTENELVLDSPQRLKAVADDTRAKILRIMEDGPASAKQLSELLKMSHGKVGHHVKVLREAGLIELVEERPVRALTERFYGLTYNRLLFAADDTDRLGFTLAQAAREALPTAEQPFDPPAVFLTVRMAPEEAAEFNRRVAALAEEFAEAANSESTHVFGMTAAVFLTDTPTRNPST